MKENNSVTVFFLSTGKTLMAINLISQSVLVLLNGRHQELPFKEQVLEGVFLSWDDTH